MKISFLVTYYNQEEFVFQSLESIFCQKIPCEFEVLVGDDGSSDQTVNKIKSFQKQYPDKIKLLEMPRDKNKKYDPIKRVSANRLNLISHATGNCLMFLDGDDFYCHTDFITQALTVFKQDSSIIGCAFDFKYVFPDKEIPFVQPFSPGKLNSGIYLEKSYFPAGAIIFKNIFLSPQKNLPKPQKFDDNIITIYMLQFGDLYYINKTIYAYRQNPDSIWNTASETEQQLLNAIDMKTLIQTAPALKKQIITRQYPAARKIYQKKKQLEKLLGTPAYTQYLQKTQDSNPFIFSLLNWNRSTFFQKARTWLLWQKLKLNKILMR